MSGGIDQFAQGGVLGGQTQPFQGMQNSGLGRFGVMQQYRPAPYQPMVFQPQSLPRLPTQQISEMSNLTQAPGMAGMIGQVAAQFPWMNLNQLSEG